MCLCAFPKRIPDTVRKGEIGILRAFELAVDDLARDLCQMRIAHHFFTRGADNPKRLRFITPARPAKGSVL